MIYKADNTLVFFQLQATYQGKTNYVFNKEEFEKSMLSGLKIEEECKAMMEGRKPNKVELPEIVYTEITHTPEEEARLEECQGLINTQLDDIIYYVMKGKLPPIDHTLKALEIRRLKKANEELSAQLFGSQTALFNAISERDDLASQIFIIQTALVEKGVM